MTFDTDASDILDNQEIIRRAMACKGQTDDLGLRMQKITRQLESMQTRGANEDVEKFKKKLLRDRQTICLELDELQHEYERLRRDALACRHLPLQADLTGSE